MKPYIGFELGLQRNSHLIIVFIFISVAVKSKLFSAAIADWLEITHYNKMITSWAQLLSVRLAPWPKCPYY